MVRSILKAHRDKLNYIRNAETEDTEVIRIISALPWFLLIFLWSLRYL